jgi:hypothetical protein
MSTATGRIHHGSEIQAGGRYDRFLAFLRSHPGATTRDLMLGAEVCAVSALASELRAMGYRIECEYKRTTESGARVHRYYLIETAAQVIQRELFA